jgi:hypothetical protein
MSGKWVRPGYYEDPVLNRSQPYSGSSGYSWLVYLACAAVVIAFLVIKSNPTLLYQFETFYNNVATQVNSAHAR